MLNCGHPHMAIPLTHGLTHRVLPQMREPHTSAMLTGMRQYWRAMPAQHAARVNHAKDRQPRGCRPSKAPLLCSLSITGADAIAVDEQTNRVFVPRSEGGAGYMSVLDAQSGIIVRTVPIGPFPGSVEVDAPTGHVFVTHDQGVTMLDARTGRVLRTIHLPGGAGRVALARNVGHIFVSGATIQNRYTLVTMIDARSGAILHATRVDVGSTVMGVADHINRVYTTTYTFGDATGKMSVLDARSGAVVRTVPIGAQPLAMSVDNQHNRVVIAEGTSVTGSNVRILDARTGTQIRTTTIDENPTTVAVDVPIQRILVTTQYAIDVLDAHSGGLIHSTKVDTPPASVPVALPRSSCVVVLLASPLNDSGQDITGPGSVLVLDGRTGAMRKHIDAGDVRSYGLFNLVAVDGRTDRVFVLDGHGLDVFDATRL